MSGKGGGRLTTYYILFVFMVNGGMPVSRTFVRVCFILHPQVTRLNKGKVVLVT